MVFNLCLHFFVGSFWDNIPIFYNAKTTNPSYCGHQNLDMTGSCMHECLIRDRFVPRTGGYPSDSLPHKVLIYSKENFPLFSVESTHHIVVSQRCQRFQRIFIVTFKKFEPRILKYFQDNKIINNLHFSNL